MPKEDARLEAIGEILYAQTQRGGISDAERTAASINNEELKKQAFGIIETISQQRYRQTCTLMICGRSWIAETFSSLYLVDSSVMATQIVLKLCSSLPHPIPLRPTPDKVRFFENLGPNWPE